MKRLISLSCLLLLLFTGCNQESTEVDTDTSQPDSSVVTETERINDTVTINTDDYTEVFFSDFPDSVIDSCSKDGAVTITGYLTDEISYDKSCGYLSNTGHGSAVTNDQVGKIIPLDLSAIDATDIGDNYVKVFGSIVNGKHFDMYNLESGYYVKVDSIVITDDIPESIKEYNEFVDSYQFDALAQVIQMVGNCSYIWKEDDTTQELPEKVECDFDTLIKDNSTDYPEIYKVIKDTLQSMKTSYETAIDCLDNGNKPENPEEFYDSFINDYTSLTENLENIALFK